MWKRESPGSQSKYWRQVLWAMALWTTICQNGPHSCRQRFRCKLWNKGHKGGFIEGAPAYWWEVGQRELGLLSVFFFPAAAKILWYYMHSFLSQSRREPGEQLLQVMPTSLLNVTCSTVGNTGCCFQWRPPEDSAQTISVTHSSSTVVQSSEVGLTITLRYHLSNLCLFLLAPTD